MSDSAGGTPTEATETVALPKKLRRIAAFSTTAGLRLRLRFTLERMADLR
jgi:hypothetical protein